MKMNCIEWAVKVFYEIFNHIQIRMHSKADPKVRDAFLYPVQFDATTILLQYKLCVIVSGCHLRATVVSLFCSN